MLACLGLTKFAERLAHLLYILYCRNLPTVTVHAVSMYMPQAHTFLNLTYACCMNHRDGDRPPKKEEEKKEERQARQQRARRGGIGEKDRMADRTGVDATIKVC